LEGRRRRSDRFRFPVYAKPRDLITVELSPFSRRFEGERVVGRLIGHQLVPYHDREAIVEKRVLAGKADVLAWVSDRVDLFFLHIQGSGKIRLGSGNIINVHYQASNGRPYRSIGKLLIEEGKIPRAEMSMQRIRSYLKRHPDDVSRVLNSNTSYVFFKIEPDGPLGNLGVVLTPGRSIATDQRLLPAGAIGFLVTEQPVVDGDGAIAGWTRLSRFVLNQDTGGAIRGPGRADLFWGHGPYAEIAAGHLRHPGTLYFLVLKQPTPEADAMAARRTVRH
jgi:membrane-bound lytic murein transglycosylase A